MCFEDSVGGFTVGTELSWLCRGGAVLSCRDEAPQGLSRRHALARDSQALEPDTAQSADAPAQCGLRADRDALGVGRLDDEHHSLVEQAVGELRGVLVGWRVHAVMWAGSVLVVAGGKLNLT